MASSRYVIAFDLAAVVFVAGANAADALGAGLFAWVMLLPAVGAFWLVEWSMERRKRPANEPG
jgi:hypothetical protein